MYQAYGRHIFDKIEGCGIAGGRSGDGHSLDYVTVITLP